MADRWIAVTIVDEGYSPDYRGRLLVLASHIVAVTEHACNTNRQKQARTSIELSSGVVVFTLETYEHIVGCLRRSLRSCDVEEITARDNEGFRAFRAVTGEIDNGG